MMWIALIGVGCAYLAWLHFTGLGIPCPVRLITGWKCPGCGISTLFLMLAEGHIDEAFKANRLLFVTMPLVLAQIVYSSVLKKKRKPLPVWNRNLLFIYLAALILFGAARNLVPGL